MAQQISLDYDNDDNDEMDSEYNPVSKLEQWRDEYWLSQPSQEWPAGLDISEANFGNKRALYRFELMFYAHVRNAKWRHKGNTVYAPYHDTYVPLGEIFYCLAMLRDIYGEDYKILWRQVAGSVRKHFSKYTAREDFQITNLFGQQIPYEHDFCTPGSLSTRILCLK